MHCYCHFAVSQRMRHSLHVHRHMPCVHPQVELKPIEAPPAMREDDTAVPNEERWGATLRAAVMRAHEAFAALRARLPADDAEAQHQLYMAGATGRRIPLCAPSAA